MNLAEGSATHVEDGFEERLGKFQPAAGLIESGQAIGGRHGVCGLQAKDAALGGECGNEQALGFLKTALLVIHIRQITTNRQCLGGSPHPDISSSVGAIPFIGPIAAEIIGHIIPNQRADRIVRFVELLEERVSHLEGSDFVQRCLQTDAVDLFEDALHQAARFKSQDRLEYIANIVTHGLTDEEQNQAEASKMLWLLGQLNDAEIIILRSRLATTNKDLSADAEFRKTHTDVLAPDVTHLGSSEDEFEEAAIKRSYHMHLHDLGLVRQRFKKPKRGEFPEFDEKTGMIKASGTDMTRLGRMLLRYLNLIPPWHRH